SVRSLHGAAARRGEPSAARRFVGFTDLVERVESVAEEPIETMVSRLGAPPGEIEVLFVDGDRGPAERETGGCDELPHLPVRMTKEEDAGGLRADRRLAGGELCNQCGEDRK